MYSLIYKYSFKKLYIKRYRKYSIYTATYTSE